MDKKEKQKHLALRVRVHLVKRSCQGCLISNLGLCSLCAGLVTDESGRLYICSAPIEDGEWSQVAVDRLSRPPKQLLIE